MFSDCHKMGGKCGWLGRDLPPILCQRSTLCKFWLGCQSKRSVSGLSDDQKPWVVYLFPKTRIAVVRVLCRDERGLMAFQHFSLYSFSFYFSLKKNLLYDFTFCIYFRTEREKNTILTTWKWSFRSIFGAIIIAWMYSRGRLFL